MGACSLSAPGLWISAALIERNSEASFIRMGKLSSYLSLLALHEAHKRVHVRADLGVTAQAVALEQLGIKWDRSASPGIQTNDHPHP